MLLLYPHLEALQFLFTSSSLLAIRVHIMLKPSMQEFKYDLTNMGDECNCLMVSTFFGITLLGNWDED